MTETPEAPAPFVTLEEFATWLKVPLYLEDPERAALLAETLGAALENVTEKVGPLDGVAVDVVVWPSGRSLVLPDSHLVAVHQITDPDGNDVALPSRGVNRLAGVIEFPRRLITGEWTVNVTTRAHHDSVRLAVKIIASHLWEVQRGTGSDTGARARVASPVGDPVPGRAGFAIPRRAAELLAPFLRPRGLG